MNEYLHLVLVYLKQELPQPYKDLITVVDDKFLIVLPDDITFVEAYDELFKLINESIKRVRVRKADFEFNIKSKYQERDFKVLKG